MASFRRAGHARVNVFEVGDVCLFKHYFEEDAVFDRLKPYYNNRQYRFEVPKAEFDGLRSFLGEYGYDLVPADATAPFVVVVRAYRAHPENIFKGSVAHRRVDEFNCFLMTDREAVERAVEGGATRLSETPLEDPF